MTADTPNPHRQPLAIDGYEIVREIDRGAQAHVYQAIQKTTNRKVAVKVIRKFPTADASAINRFLREIKLLGQLSHPNIVSILHSGTTSDGRHFFAMEYVRGLPVRRFVVDKKLTVEQTLQLFVTIARAVGFLHQHGIIHRDLKPSNVLVEADGNAKVLDFGLAKALDAPTETLATQTGVMLGSLVYMSPEQTRGAPDEVDVRSDVYSLGVVLFEMLTGEFPYILTGQITDIIRRITESTPRRPSAAWHDDLADTAEIAHASAHHHVCPIDATLDAVVAKALEKEQRRRYANANEFADDVERYLRGEPTVARPDRWHESVVRSARRFAQRHRSIACVAAVVCCALLARIVGAALVFSWTPLDRMYEGWLTSVVTPRTDHAPFDALRIITITPQTDVEALALAEGLEGVSRESWTSVRLLHGRLMEKLAQSGCRALAWDIRFNQPSAHDGAFVRGVEAMRAAKIGVAVAVGPWWLGKDGKPELSETIMMSDVRWGGIKMAQDRLAPWSLQLVARRGLADPLPSLSLAAFAAYRQPGAQYRIDFNTAMRAEQAVDLVYWFYDPRIPTARQWVDPADHITLTNVRPAFELGGPGIEDTGLSRTEPDFVGLLNLDIPPKPLFEARQIEYADVLSADPSQLRAWFEDKLVFVGDLRPGADEFELNDRRVLPGVYAHVAAVEQLLKSTSITAPGWTHNNTVPFFGAIIGALAGTAVATRVSRRLLVVAAITALVIATSVLAYWRWQFLFNPFVMILAVWIAAEAIAAVQRVPRHRHI